MVKITKKITLIIFSLLIQILLGAQCDTLYILQSTDIHGHIYPYDYLNEEEASWGLAKISTIVNKYRKLHDHVILVDCGDMIQGTPLTDYYHQERSTEPEPMIQIMNAMKYDVFTVGNHDIEQGPEIYDKARQESNFPWLSANSTLPNGLTYFEPYTIIPAGDLKVGFLGLTTPGIPKWMDDSLFPNITWSCMINTSRYYFTKLKEKSDLIVGVFHAGFTDEAKDFGTGEPLENASGVVADLIPGFDVIFGGHTHRTLPSEPVVIKDDSPLKINSGSRGRFIGIVEIRYQKINEKFTILSKKGWLELVAGYPPDQEILALASKAHEATKVFIDSKITNCSGNLNTENARYVDNALLDMIQEIQLLNSGATISFTSCFDTGVEIDSGNIKRKDIYQLYPYPNFLYTVKMSPEQIKMFLEYSSKFYVCKNNLIEADPEIPGYSLDIAEGIEYRIDPKADYGERVNISAPENFFKESYYKVALNSFRASGGGGYLKALGIDSLNVISRSKINIPEMITSYLREITSIEPKPSNNWKILDCCE